MRFLRYAQTRKRRKSRFADPPLSSGHLWESLIRDLGERRVCSSWNRQVDSVASAVLSLEAVL